MALICLLSCLASSTPLSAQETPGTIVGVVKDQDGAFVTGADVLLLHQQRAIVGSTTTDAEGKFTLANVPPGNYEIKISHSGFNEQRAAVQVASGASNDLNLSLHVHSVSAEVTVSAEAGMVVDARNIDQQVNVITQKEIIDRAPEVVAQVVDEEPGVNLQRTTPGREWLVHSPASVVSSRSTLRGQMLPESLRRQLQWWLRAMRQTVQG